MKTKLFYILLLCFGISAAQENKFNSKNISVSAFIDGTLLLPTTSEEISLVIIIGGSGPTDRNGNQQMMENNSLRFLAEALYNNGIASYRYDKRIVKLMKNRTLREKDIRFDDFITDAETVTDYFKNGGEFSKIYIIGHSQGSLVGMIAAQGRADGFISIAGAGQEIDDVIVDQIANQSPGLKESARTAYDDLRVNGVALNYSPSLASLFRPDLQPFMSSWMKFDPQIEVAKLKIPVLIVNGDKDIQVQISEAEHLHEAQPNAEYFIVENMNHILKKIEGSDLENTKSYNIYNLPIMPELVERVSTFIKK
ncbi:MAG: pimeloyl-ACP methyl ester carboxylesterase [Ulvibacter sp.]|jgi:pimeloyl-ACP methyl ester carboxylesterase